MPFPFSAAELQKALELIMSPEAAANMADAFLDDPHMSFDETGGHGVTGDTLILLSLLSRDLRERVEQYLVQFDPDAVDEQWRARTAEIERALKDSGRLPRY